MRKRIFEIIEGTKPDDNIADTYDAVMFFMTIISIAPLMFKSSIQLYVYTDVVAFIFFVMDYILRWGTADYKCGERKLTTFVKYPFTLMAVIDLLSLLPFITYLNSSFRILRMFRGVKTLRIFRIFRTMKHTGSMGVILEVMRNSKKALLEVASLALGYIIISALIIYNIEPDSFKTFFDAIYWATVSLTTVGYGDIYPITTVGRTVAMISSAFGIAIVALPSGIVTAGYIAAISKKITNEKDVIKLLNDENEENQKSDTEYINATSLNDINNLMKNLGLTKEQAMRAIGIPEKEFNKYNNVLDNIYHS